MVCSSPLRISNSKIAYHTGMDKPFLSVPCGKCFSCRFHEQEDWCIRAYYHWLKYQRLHGKVIFATLTYSNRSLPMVHDGKYNFSCFSKKDIDRFLNSFRQHFKRKFHIGENGSVGIDYLVCCEYGSQNTFRPHYHILLFIPDCDHISVPYIKKIVNKIWFVDQHKGWIIWSKEIKGGALVSSHKAIQYVSKYVTKDLDFYGKQDIMDYLSFEGNKEKIKHNLPHHWQSKGFGSYLADFVMSSPDRDDLIADGVHLPCETYRYKLPRYIVNKLLTRNVITDFVLRTTPSGSPVYRQVRLMSNFGYNYRVSRFVEDFRKRYEKLSLDTSNLGLSKYFTNLLDLNSYMNELGLNYFNDWDFVKLEKHLLSHLNGHTVYDLAAYDLVYRGYAYHRDFNLDSLSVDYLTESAPRVYGERLKFNFADESYKYFEYQLKPSHHGGMMLDVVPDYYGFEYILDFLDKLRSRLAFRKSSAKNEKLENARFIKQKLLGV